MSEHGTHSKSSSLGAVIYPLKDNYKTQTQIPLTEKNQETITNFLFESLDGQDKNQVAQGLTVKFLNLDESGKRVSIISQKSQSPKLEQLQMITEQKISQTLDTKIALQEQNGNSKLEVIVNKDCTSPPKLISKLKSDMEESQCQSRSQPLQRRSSTKTASRINGASILEDEYFGEDNKKKSNERRKLVNPDFFYKLRDHQTQWNSKIFLEFLVYHILFYYFLGPLINIIFIKKKALMRNLSFQGLNKWFFLQTFVFILNFTTLALYYSHKNSNIYKVEIIYLQVTIFLRICVISCKYATLPLEKIDLYKNFILSSQLTANDYYFAKWVFQDTSTIYRETYNALQRGEFDPQMFYIGFFVNPSDDKIKIMEECVDELKKFHKHEDIFNPPCAFNPNPEDPETKFFFGYSVIFYLIRRFQEANKNKSYVIQCVILAVIRGFSTFVYRYLTNDSKNFESSEIFQIAAIIINTTLGYFSSFVFLAYFIRDLKMKYFLLSQIKLMLQYRKINANDNKELPTIDFTNPYSLKGWSILRRVILDYGKQFFIRLQIFLTMYIIVGSVGLVLMLLQIYNVTNVEGSVVVVCVFEVLIILSAALYMLLRGSMINETFTEFKNTLIDYKVIIADLILLKDIYFFKDCKIHSLLRRKSVEKLNQTFNQIEDKDKYDFIAKYLSQIEYSIQDCEKELDQDQLNQPFTLFSIKITKAQFSSIMVGLGTVAGTLLQQIIKGYNEKYGNKQL